MFMYVVYTHYKCTSEMILTNTHNVPYFIEDFERYPKLFSLSLLIWLYEQLVAELPMSKINFHGPKCVQPIEVPL